jgi:hypothetical protein
MKMKMKMKFKAEWKKGKAENRDEDRMGYRILDIGYGERAGAERKMMKQELTGCGGGG